MELSGSGRFLFYAWKWDPGRKEDRKKEGFIWHRSG